MTERGRGEVLQSHQMCSDVERTAEKTDTAFICHAMNAFQHPSVKDEYKADLNRNNSSSAACVVRTFRYEERGQTPKNSTFFTQTMKTV